MRRTKLHPTTAFLLAALGLGCGTQVEDSEPRPLTAVQAASKGGEEPLPEEENPTLARTPPVVKELFVTPQEKPGKETYSLLEVRFAEGTELKEAIEFFPDDNQRVALRDDGKEGDEKAGDGVFSAFLRFNFEELIEQDKRIEELEAKFGEKLLVPQFDGRELIREVRPVRLDLELLVPGVRIPLHPLYGGFSFITPPSSLFINHPSVVTDPTRTANACNPQAGDAQKVWSFGYLMTHLANQPRTHISPAAFARNWLETWRYDQVVNGWTSPARTSVDNIIQQWEEASGGSVLDMDKAPFKLLAIVNRIDLAENTVYGGGGAGEGRFIFAWVDKNCRVRPFTVIFEYGIPANGCTGLKHWASRWKALDTMAPGSSAFNAHLQGITESFVRANTVPSKPNGSALNQLRTNENALARLWQLREFRLPAGDGYLYQSTVAQTPDNSLNNASLLGSYASANQTAILQERHDVPNIFLGQRFEGAHSDVPSVAFHWRVPGVSNNVRHKFSLNTCNGCHAGETATSFTHIDPQTGGLSRFLAGGTVNDPVSGTPRHFNDLARRAARLDSIANQSCLFRSFDVRVLAH